VDDVDLPHFGPNYDERTNTVTCWIPSQPGKAFSFWWKPICNVAPKGCIVGRIYLDGASKTAAGAFVEFGEEVTKSGARISDCQVAPFLFAELKLTGALMSQSRFSPLTYYRR
jgi:hypothetical protein